MDNSTPIIVAVIGALGGIISAIIGQKLSQKGKEITPYDGDDIREEIMELAIELISSPGNYFLKAYFWHLLFCALAGMLSAILRFSLVELFIVIILLSILFLIPYYFVALNGLVKDLKSLGMSKKEILEWQKIVIRSRGMIRFVGMQIINKLLLQH